MPNVIEHSWLVRETKKCWPVDQWFQCIMKNINNGLHSQKKKSSSFDFINEHLEQYLDSVAGAWDVFQVYVIEVAWCARDRHADLLNQGFTRQSPPRGNVENKVPVTYNFYRAFFQLRLYFESVFRQYCFLQITCSLTFVQEAIVNI